MKYPLVIFDFDGTLADSFPWFTEALNRVAEEYGLQPLDPVAIEAVAQLIEREGS